MERMKANAVAQACALIGALMLSGGAQAEADAETEGDPAYKASKQALELEKLRIGVDKDRADLNKSLVPDLSAYKRAAPSAVPEVAATTSRFAYLQAVALAESVANSIRINTTAKSIILESPNHLGYLSSLSSVEALLVANSRSVSSLTVRLDRMRSQQDPTPPPPAAPPQKDAKGFGAAAAVPALQLGFAVATALRPSYAMGGTKHDDLSTKALKANVISLLGCQLPAQAVVAPAATAPPSNCNEIVVYDADSAIQWPINEDAELESKVLDLANKVEAARTSLLEAEEKIDQLTDAAKPATADGKPDPGLTQRAAKIAALAKLLSADADNAAKYLVALHTPTDTGLTPLVAAKRGLWLNKQLKKKADEQPPRLTLTSVVAATDLIAADSWFKGLRVSVSGNTIVEWRLVLPDGKMKTGTAQSCGDATITTCKPLILRPDDKVRSPGDPSRNSALAPGGE